VIRISTGMISAATKPPPAKGSQMRGLFDRPMGLNPCCDQNDERHRRPGAIVDADDRLGGDRLASHHHRHGLAPFVRTKQAQVRSGASAAVLSFATPKIGIPNYLLTHYWWAYVHPKAVKLFERQWLVNLILWGNYERLRDATLAEMEESLGGRSLHVACVYGDLTSRLSRRIASRGGVIDVVDVLPVQLRNLREKLPKGSPARLLAMDSTNLR
jgi:hypothetical protein